MKSQDAYQKNQYGDKFQYLLYSPYGNGKNYQNLSDETYLFMPTSKYFKSNEVVKSP
jgi:dTDP-4-dehydrorhamnose 3,5-epimerase-like enzyme